MMRALGAEVVLVDQLPDSRAGQVSGSDLELVERAAREITRDRHAFCADQFRHPGNFRAHYLHTGSEILEQTGGQIDSFCDFAGTGGTFAGCAAVFKECNPAIQCFIVEPSLPQHRIQSGGYNTDLPILRLEHVDGRIPISDDDAIAAARLPARTEGIFAGYSSGANIAAAMKLLPGRTVVTIINDSGLKFLSTDLWP